MSSQVTLDWNIREDLGGDQFGSVHALDATRVARIIPSHKLDTGNGVREKLLDRVAELESLHLPHVAVPIASRDTDGAVYLVERRFANQLSVVLPADTGLPVNDATNRFFELLDGLAALHARKIVHGDVRAENVFLDMSGSAWLTDVAIGQLWWWSKGECISQRAPDYYPPEWSTGAKEPTGQSDIYMLGVLASEMYLGRKSVRQKARGDGDFWTSLQPKLKRANVPAGVRKLLGRMLDPDPASRPPDAVAIKAYHEKGHQHSMRCKLAVLIFAMVLLVLWLGIVALSQKAGRDQAVVGLVQTQELLDEAERQRSQLETQLDETNTGLGDTEDQLRQTEAKLTQVEAERDEAKAELEKIIGRGPELPNDSLPPTPKELAQQIWNSLPPPLGPDDWEGIRERLRQEPTEVRVHLVRWFNATRDLWVKGRRWLVADAVFSALYRQAAEEPWDDTRLQASHTRLENLNSAAEKFYAWARDTNLPFADVDTLSRGNEILETWHRQIVERRTRPWTIQLTDAKAPERWGTRRSVAVQGTRWVEGDDHRWTSPTKHVYGPDEAGHRIEFRWEPDEPMGLILYGERGWDGRRWRLIDARDQFRGPLALWLMHVAGSVSDERGFVVNFEIVDCPGPPREVIRGLTGALKETLTGR